MSDPRERFWKVLLEDGRQITIGCSVDEDRGVWLLSNHAIIRWLTASDSARLATALSEAAAHLLANPPFRSKTKKGSKPLKVKSKRIK